MSPNIFGAKFCLFTFVFNGQVYSEGFGETTKNERNKNILIT